MPRQKDLKRLVRARMKKTGEAYTAARAQVVRKAPAPAVAADDTPSTTTVSAGAISSPDYASLAGMSDAAIKAKTGCTWEKWVHALDRRGCERMSHGEIAEIVKTKYKVESWWSQNVTVGYERIKGLRTRGQKRDGSFETTKSRTYNVPIGTLYAAWADAATRRRWMNGARTRVRTATAPKSIRLDWSDGTHAASSIIAAGFVAKGKGKSAVALAHAKLPDRETANRLKEYWSERLEALHEVLAES